jgi:hypothetical protein
MIKIHRSKYECIECAEFWNDHIVLNSLFLLFKFEIIIIFYWNTVQIRNQKSITYFTRYILKNNEK